MVFNVTYYLFGISLIAGLLLYQIQRDYLKTNNQRRSSHKKRRK